MTFFKRALIFVLSLTFVSLSAQVDTPDKKPAYAEVVELNHCAGRYAQSVFLCQTKKKRTLPIDSVQDFLRIVNSRKSYGQGVAACHDPGIGLILYNKAQRPVSWYSLCMSCNNVYAEPAMSYTNYEKSGFSRKTRKKLRKIFRDWGFSYVGASEMFDSKADFEKMLKESGYGK